MAVTTKCAWASCQMTPNQIVHWTDGTTSPSCRDCLHGLVSVEWCIDIPTHYREITHIDINKENVIFSQEDMALFGVSSQAYQERLQLRTERLEAERKASIRTCPGCKFSIRRSGGCYMMTCPLCQHKFYFPTGETEREVRIRKGKECANGDWLWTPVPSEWKDY